MSNIDQTEPNVVENTTIPPLGEVLAEARLAKKLTQKDASDFLRYSVAQVNALENNQLDALPQAMITRGFIRNYARYLSLDAEPLLASYKLRMPTPIPNTVHVGKSNRQVMLTKESQPWLKYILGSIVVLLFLLTWLISVEFLPKDFFSLKANSTDVDLVQNTANPLPQPIDSDVVMTEQAAILGSTIESTENTGEAESAENAVDNAALNQDGSQKKAESVQSFDALTANTTKVEALVGEASANAVTSSGTVAITTKPNVGSVAAPATNAAPTAGNTTISKPNLSNPNLGNAVSPGLSPAKSTIANSATAVTKTGMNTTNISMPSSRSASSPLATIVKDAANAKTDKTVSSSPATVSLSPVKTATVANAAVKAPVESTGNNQQLNLSFSEQTWVQVTDKSGVIVYERILAAGAQESIAGAKPLNVIIGNAKATKLSIMGKPVDLKPYTTENNVARVRLE